MKVDRGVNARTHWRHDGTSKVEYLTNEEAAIAARSLEDYDLEMGELSRIPWPYECERGGHWHVGNIRYSAVPGHTRGQPDVRYIERER